MFKVYVGNLDQRVTPEVLRPLFEPFGDLDEIIVAKDPKTNRSRGFAIVLFRDPLKGQLAIETLTGRRLNGRTIVINEAAKRGKVPPKPYGVGGGRGPFGPRFGAAVRGGASGGRRFSSRNPRRGFAAGGPAATPGSGSGATGPGTAAGAGPQGSPLHAPGAAPPAKPANIPSNSQSKGSGPAPDGPAAPRGTDP